MLAPVASKIRRPSSPSMATGAKSYRFADSRAAVSRASNCRRVNPSVGDSGGTDGRRTCSAGECSSTPSITHVRQNPAATENRRDTVDGLNRRSSCIHRMYSSRSGRRRGQRIKAAPRTPGEITTQVGLSVLTGRALEPAQIGSGCQQRTIGRSIRQVREPLQKPRWPAGRGPGRPAAGSCSSGARDPEPKPGPMPGAGPGQKSDGVFRKMVTRVAA